MRRELLALVLAIGWALPASAHLMVAQKGTLNLVQDGAFLVLSLPVSAFPGVDRDADGSLSAEELAAGQAQIAQMVQDRVVLADAQGRRPLQGLLVTASPDNDTPGAPVHQVVVLGRYALAQPVPRGSDALRLSMPLLGTREGEQRAEVTVTQAVRSSLLVFDAQRTTSVLFPSRGQVFVDTLKLGVQHILSGPDHLLFLAVSLLGLSGWRQVLAVLTTFTAGHAVTLALGSLGVVVLPGWLVESAIATTIVLLAAVEWLLHRRGRSLPLRARLVLVGGCALVHGLGFAAAVRDLGLVGERLWPTIVGFNLGIELGQVAVAVPLLWLLAVWRRRFTAAAR